jgi:hypothetical protein
MKKRRMLNQIPLFHKNRCSVNMQPWCIHPIIWGSHLMHLKKQNSVQVVVKRFVIGDVFENSHSK